MPWRYSLTWCSAALNIGAIAYLITPIRNFDTLSLPSIRFCLANVIHGIVDICLLHKIGGERDISIVRLVKFCGIDQNMLLLWIVLNKVQGPYIDKCVGYESNAQNKIKQYSAFVGTFTVNIILVICLPLYHTVIFLAVSSNFAFFALIMRYLQLKHRHHIDAARKFFSIQESAYFITLFIGTLSYSIPHLTIKASVRDLIDSGCLQVWDNDNIWDFYLHIVHFVLQPVAVCFKHLKHETYLSLIADGNIDADDDIENVNLLRQTSERPADENTNIPYYNFDIHYLDTFNHPEREKVHLRDD